MRVHILPHNNAVTVLTGLHEDAASGKTVVPEDDTSTDPEKQDYFQTFVWITIILFSTVFRCKDNQLLAKTHFIISRFSQLLFYQVITIPLRLEEEEAELHILEEAAMAEAPGRL